MYKVLYRVYRPETFDDMLGQTHIVKILKNQILKDKVHHAYLFCGTRGTGKTSTARLLAKGINCLAIEDKPCGSCTNCNSIKEGNFLDLVEIDAASNTGVDHIREIRDSIKYPPAVGRKKIYIIDEVHMLSNAAFNAFLKTLEEPPEYVVFILATTEPHKLPATILSRCLRLDFRRVAESELLDRMKMICKEQQVIVEENALKLIAANGDGSVRDCLTLLDQCISTGEKQISRNDVLDTIGTVDSEAFLRLTEASLENNIPTGIMIINEILSEGKDPKQILSSWLQHFRNLMLIKYVASPEEMLNMSVENISRLKRQSVNISIEGIGYGIEVLTEIIQLARDSSQSRVLLEIAFVKLCNRGVLKGNDYFQDEGLNQDSEEISQVKSIVSREEASTGDFEKVIENFTGEEKVNSDNSQEVALLNRLKNLSDSEGDDELEEESTRESEPTKETPSQYNVQEIWGKISKAAANKEPSFQMVTSLGISLLEITKKEFVINIPEDKREIAERYIESHRELMEKLFFEFTQEKKVMALGKVKKIEETKENNSEIDSIEKSLGLCIEFEEDL